MNKRRTSKAFIVRAAMTLLLLLLTSATAWAADGVKYIDADGQEKTQDGVTVLSGGGATNLGEENREFWYVVTGDNIEYTGTLRFSGDTHIILADGANISIKGSDGIIADNLTIYGQSEGTGSLSTKATGSEGDGIYASGIISIIGGIITATSDYHYGITNESGNIIITGGKVTATGENGIAATGNITINGGNVIANGTHYGIIAEGTVTLDGGIVTANETGNITPRAGICAKEGTNANTIYLGGAIINASSYSGTVTVKSGVTYINKDLTNIDVSTIGGITIFPTICFGIASGNNGSKEKPYTITSPEELQLLASLVNEGNTFISKYIQLSNDFDMYGIVFRPIGVDSKFCGNFDGGGYIISNLFINIDDTCIGLFGLVDDDNATIQNITISNATINGQEYVGGIVGSLNNGSIKNCFVINSTITSSAPGYYSCGAIVGKRGNSSILANNYYCGCTINVSGTSYEVNAGCGSSSKTEDVTANDGAVSATILSESEEVPSDLSGKVLFYREFTGGKASTICLPFAYTPKTNDGTFYTFDGITKKGEGSSATYEAKMTAVTSTSLSPNMPYLFVPAGDNTLKPVLFHGTAASSISPGTTTNTPWSFIGTYKRLAYYDDISSLSDEDKASALTGPVYGFAAKTKDVGVEGQGQVEAGEFVRAMTGAYVPAMRCYLKYNTTSTRGEIEELPERITVKLVGDPTSIGTLNTQTGEVTFDGWYSLDGQRFNSKPTKKGLYIYKGIKVTIK